MEGFTHAVQTESLSILRKYFRDLQMQGAVTAIDAVVSAATGVTMGSQGHGGFTGRSRGHGGFCGWSQGHGGRPVTKKNDSAA